MAGLYSISEAVAQGKHTWLLEFLPSTDEDFSTPQTLQSYTQFKEIPRKLIVAKRLSQCLIPALPSGVHQRALDVYSHILSVLGVSMLC